MAEYTEYQKNNVLHLNYGIELFPNLYQSPVIKKNTQEEALLKLKVLLRNNGFAFLTGKILRTLNVKILYLACLRCLISLLSIISFIPTYSY